MKLAEHNPTLFSELLHVEGVANTADVQAGSSKKGTWQGNACNHVWTTPIRVRVQGAGCPYCTNTKVLPGFNDLATTHPAIAAQWHPENTKQPAEVLASSTTKYRWECSNPEHEWYASVINRTRHASICKACKKEQSNQVRQARYKTKPWTAEETAHLDSYATETTRQQLPNLLRSSNTQHTWVCPEQHTWKTTTATILKHTTPCPQCRQNRKNTSSKGSKAVAATHPALITEWASDNSYTPQQLTPGSAQTIRWRCPQQHTWEAPIYSRTNPTSPSGCPRCASTISTAEQQLADYFRTQDPTLTIIAQDRTTLNGKELDLHFPDRQLAIEFNGLYWHDENHKPRTYHYDKWLACKEQGIQLIQIWEDDWNRNPEQVKRMLAHKLHLPTQSDTVMARKTTVTPITNQQAKEFLQRYHIQGYTAGQHYLGLTDANQTLTALMVLKQEPNTDGKALHLIRYATSVTVPGGFTKLLRHVERTLTPEKIITFSDHCVSNGDLYRNNGFTADKELPPDYMYIVKKQRMHKFNYRLKRFRNDETLTWREGYSERQLAQLNNIPRIWDAGKTRWVKHC